MRKDTKIIGFGDSTLRYGLHNGLTVSVVWRHDSYYEKDRYGNPVSAEMACFDTHSDESCTVWRTQEVWESARRSDVLMNVPQERVLELVTEAEKWRCPRCKKS